MGGDGRGANGSQPGARAWDPAALVHIARCRHVLSASGPVSKELPLGFSSMGRCGHGSKESDGGTCLAPSS